MVSVLLVAPLAVTPLFGAETTDLFQLFSPAFLIAGLRVVPQAMLQRALDFRRLSLIEIAATLSGACLSVLLASAADLDAEAYVCGTLGGGAIALVLLAAAARPPLPRWRRRELRELLSFGLPAGAAGVVWVGNRNVDYAILGATMAPAQVGYYYRAYTLGVESEQRVSGIVSRLILPVYSRTRDLNHMRDVRARVIRANAMIVFPLLALFISVAPTLVPWMFGQRWEPAVLPAQILAVGGMASMINGNIGPMVLAAGKPRVLAVFNTCQLCAFALTVLAAASFGIVAVASAVAAFHVCALVIAYVVVLGRVAGLRLPDLLHDVGPAVLTSVLLVIVALPTDAVLASAGAAALPTMLAAAAAGGIVSQLAARSFFPSAFADVVLVTRRVVGFRGRHEPSAVPLAEGGAGAV
jgi:PST family polysaccharide transporter/lipopolysaccharide exporter